MKVSLLPDYEVSINRQNAWIINFKEPEVKFEFAVDVVDVVFGEGDGVVQHVLELGQHVRDLPHDHGEGRDAGVRARRYVGALSICEVAVDQGYNSATIQL